MKKVANVLFSILLTLPIFVGICFLTPETAPITLNGGGGNHSKANNKNSNGVNEDKSYIEYNYFSTSDYINDFSVPNNIEETTITGTGTEEDPFAINSTSDFVFMFCSDASLSNVKSVELNCDINFNDEKFDENGVPSGGDGKVYSYKYNTNFKNSNYKFNGNGYSIKGIYSNESRNNNLYILSCYNLENVNFENIYLNVPTYCVYRASIINSGISIQNIENCHINSGVICHPLRACGFAWNIQGEIRNCTNSAKIAGGSSANAFVNQAAIIENCINYGEISGDAFATGIGAANKITKCVNYGSIGNKGSSGCYSSGIGIAATITNCINYGEIYGGYNSGRAGGIFYATNSNVAIINCANYGDIKTGYIKGQIIGTSGGSASNRSNIIISNCKYKTTCGSPCVGAAQTSYSTIKIYKCVFDYSKCSKGVVHAVVGFNYSYKLFKIVIKNSEIIGGESRQIDLFYGDANQSYIIKNVLIKITDYTTVERFLDPAVGHLSKYDYDGVLIIKNNGNPGYYYGSDFSGFYVDFKTGKLGLKALSGKGFYQGKVTEEYLINKGFSKKS